MSSNVAWREIPLKKAVYLSSVDALPPNVILTESLRALASNIKIKFNDNRSVQDIVTMIKDEYKIG